MTSYETAQNKHRQEPASGGGPKQQGPGIELLLSMGSRLHSPAQGSHSGQERDLDKEQDHEQDRGACGPGAVGSYTTARATATVRAGTKSQAWAQTLPMRDRNGKRRKEATARTSTVRTRGNSAQIPGGAPLAPAWSMGRTGQHRAGRGTTGGMDPSPLCPPSAPLPHHIPKRSWAAGEPEGRTEETGSSAEGLGDIQGEVSTEVGQEGGQGEKKQEKIGCSEEYMGYTITDNPFGDNNLLSTFIWSKALEKEWISHLDEKNLKERIKQIQEDNRLELQKMKQLCLEQEREKAEQELEMLQREKEAEHFKTWEEQEDKFHLQQAKLQSKIHIPDGREKPIDLLAKDISAEDDYLAVEMHKPYTFLNGLTISDMEDLVEDIQVYMKLDQGKNTDVWTDMTITEDEIAKLCMLDASRKGGPGEHHEASRKGGPGNIINALVSSDAQAVFKGKTYNQLQALYQGIKSKIQAGRPNLDTGYWESLLHQLKADMAQAKLQEQHQDMLRQKLYKLKQEQGVECELLLPIIKQEPASLSNRLDPEESLDLQPGPSSETEQDTEAKGEAEGEAVLMEEDLIQQSLDDYDVSKYSPQLLGPNELPCNAHMLEAKEDTHQLLLLCQQLQVTGNAPEDTHNIIFHKAKEDMGADEAQFSVEMPLTGQAYLWADKYQPCKPRFFNSVHTGFKWNKYNQTHYDTDNPPPKTVQGYKFNIFYPNLIEKRSMPKYFLEACQDSKDFAILCFHAGPPYEDITFKIVSRVWEYSHRHGFCCQFANGIFQLWFHFRQYRYHR